MKREFASLARPGLVALGLLAGMPLAAQAGPAGFGPMTVPQASSDLTQVQCRGNGCRSYRGNGWNGNGWRGNGWHGNRWNGNNWNGNYYRHYGGWRGRYYRPFYNGYFGGSGIYFNFGVPAYSYYAQPYYQPRYYEPQRIYRSGSSAHEQWCYDRYRSYRAWDNTFQPYNGPRRQCWSPYG